MSDFGTEKGQLNIAVCGQCKHHLGGGKCVAFPHKIPIEILLGENKHTKPFKNDNGIIFEPIEKKELEKY